MMRQIYSSMTKLSYFSSCEGRSLSTAFLRGGSSRIVSPCFSTESSRTHMPLGIRSFTSRPQSTESRKSGAVFQATFPYRASFARCFSTSHEKESAHLLSPKIDIVFKDFFGDKGSKEILESFINLFLDLHGNDEIEIEEFLDPRKMRIEAGKPTTFVDLSVKTKSGERYIIEMQTYNHEGFDKRLLYYLGKDYTEQLSYDMETFKEGEKVKKHNISWHNLPKVHVIAITSYGILKSDGIVETFRFHPTKSGSNRHLFDRWRATIIDLTKFTTRSFDKVESERDQWLFLMKSADKLNHHQVETMKQRPVFKTALERLERISSDSEKRKEYEQSLNEIRDWDAVLDYSEAEGRIKGEAEGRIKGEAEGRIKGEAEGRIKGEAEGERKKALEIAKKMLEMGFPIEKVVKSTGISREEAEEIQKKLS